VTVAVGRTATAETIVWRVGPPARANARTALATSADATCRRDLIAQSIRLVGFAGAAWRQEPQSWERTEDATASTKTISRTIPWTEQHQPRSRCASWRRPPRSASARQQNSRADSRSFPASAGIEILLNLADVLEMDAAKVLRACDHPRLADRLVVLQLVPPRALSRLCESIEHLSAPHCDLVRAVVARLTPAESPVERTPATTRSSGRAL